MIYLMKQKLFSWGDDFTIQDEAGQDLFFCRRQGLQPGKSTFISGMAGNELGILPPEAAELGPTEVDTNGVQPRK